MAGQRTHWATGLLLLACAGLGGIVALETLDRLPFAPAVTAAAPSAVDLPTLPEPRQYEPPSPEQFAATSARPLFSPSRRPYVPPQEVVPEPTAPEPEVVATPLTLVGVFLAEGRHMALLLPEDRSQASWIRVGEELAGWRVQRVGQDSVELHHGDRVEIVELRDDEIAPAGGPPAQAVQRPLVPPPQNDQGANGDAASGTEGDPAQKASSADD